MPSHRCFYSSMYYNHLPMYTYPVTRSLLIHTIQHIPMHFVFNHALFISYFSPIIHICIAITFIKHPIHDTCWYHIYTHAVCLRRKYNPCIFIKLFHSFIPMHIYSYISMYLHPFTHASLFDFKSHDYIIYIYIDISQYFT